MATSLSYRTTVSGSMADRFDEILTPEALEFVARLDNEFAGRRRELLDARRRRKEKLNSGEEELDFLAETAHIRSDSSWRVAGAAAGLSDRRVEIAGPPADRATVEEMVTSGAHVWLADFEDGLSPTWANVMSGQLNLHDAVRGATGATGDGRATIAVRPRGWHMVEKHVRIDGRPVSASLFDFGLYFFHNVRELLDRGSGPYFCLPKVESHHEARLWNDVFVTAQRLLDVQQGTIRATVLIETVTAAFEMEEILYELREHAAGLNAGRWDYIFSIIKNFSRRGGDFVLPNRAEVTMSVPFLRAYTELLVDTCHKRGAQAIGDMTAVVPSTDTDRNTEAIAVVREDTEREIDVGFDGSWVAHPAMVGVCREVYDTRGESSSEQGAAATARPARSRPEVTRDDLLHVAGTGGEVTEDGLRHNIRVALRYIDSWLAGTGTVTIGELREDAATAEISRSQVWQWMHNQTKLDDGTAIDAELVTRMLDEEVATIRAERGGADDRLDDARAIFIESALSETLPSFFTTCAYARYLTHSV
ncbi:malate synthase A [Haloechinothrix sp. LS1_15]|uniref:malate synthase A n=1 Tax=Haloechinothrix sp. LS1_15 TaxID=2652248 RepID=UPI002944ECCE|nr:malate synthase A [Haloechinothrix sp. LS1_15]MDV6013530.1 malate synthase A [Haloechinothrix sp. LS1_15]